MRVWTQRLAKLRRLKGPELSDLFRAQAALIAAQVLVWTRPKGHFVSTVADRASADPAPEAAGEAQRLALAVERAAENGVFRPLCLVRAVALNRMLEARGVHGSRVRIGVQRKKSRFAAHAWVELGPLVLGDRQEHVSRFIPLSDVEVLP